MTAIVPVTSSAMLGLETVSLVSQKCDARSQDAIQRLLAYAESSIHLRLQTKKKVFQARSLVLLDEDTAWADELVELRRISKLLVGVVDANYHRNWYTPLLWPSEIPPWATRVDVVFGIGVKCPAEQLDRLGQILYGHLGSLIDAEHTARRRTKGRRPGDTGQTSTPYPRRSRNCKPTLL